MTQRKYPAAFMRGGTSKALMFHARDLPDSRARWDEIFLAAMGSPDPAGRQLDGMGGGLSSLSKVCVLAPSARSDADIDYTFAQVQIREASVDYSGNCGNMSSAIGPFAVEEGLVPAADGEALVRIFNTNTQKVIHATFEVRNGRPLTHGELEIPGVAGGGAPIRLDFIEPGGAATGKLLPTGRVRDTLDIPGVGVIEVSMVDAANACVFVAARALGLRGTEMPEELERNTALLEKLAAIRLHASVAMGIAPDIVSARAKAAVPFIGFVSPPQDSPLLAGGTLAAGDIDFTARFLSSGQPHRALPLAASLCTAVAARISGSVAHAVCTPGRDERLRIGMPSGVLTVGAEVRCDDAQWHATRGSFYRTARRLFDGFVYA
jgi:2-methylaconitate cis-trans-isomerase PrpF